MSSAFYPQGMNTSNNRLPQGGYKSLKGKGILSFKLIHISSFLINMV